MHTYEVSFRWNGKVYRETVTTTNSFKARDLIKNRYSGEVVITSVREV